MPVDLHGGGVRFVAEKSVHDVAAAGSEAFPLDFVGFGPKGRVDGAVITHLLEKQAERGGFRRRVSEGAKALLAEHGRSAPVKAAQTKAGAHARMAPDAVMADALPRAYYPIVQQARDDQLPHENLVLKLGDKMRQAGGPGAQADSAIPALYTYLGQFIAHDMTSMRVDGQVAENWRTHALDLDSIFGSADQDCVPPADAPEIAGVRIGRTRNGAFRDLPRCADPACAGRPCIPDTRNDNNLLVAQLTVAILRFHRRITELANADLETCKDITRRHVQSIILHDYLPRITHAAVWNAFTGNGQHAGQRAVLFPQGASDAFLVPIEFAAACFRFGHSQIRSSYPLNNLIPAQDAFNIRRHTYLGGVLSSPPKLEDNWVVDLPGLMLQNAASIGPVLNSDLLSLPPEWIDDPDAPRDGITRNLAKITLWRGHTLRLPTGQMLQQHLAGFLPAGSPELDAIAGHVLLPAGGSHAAALLSSVERNALREKTPLWFYTLREAELHGGGRLGPLASRIVVETIHAAIESAPNNIISSPPFQVLDGIAAPNRTRFTLADLVNAANLA